MRNLKPVTALVLTGLGSALVATFHVAEPTAIGGTTVPVTTATTAATTTGTGTVTSGATASATAASAATLATASTTASGAQYADGTYAGTAVQEPWGTFQVQATISGGRLVTVTVVSEPSDGHSSRINSSAVPVLTQAAVAAQNAQVDTVSGATWTSDSYRTSLQAALDAAAAAATTTSTAG
jgi:uncharacterized protein with FMN-binding domain